MTTTTSFDSMLASLGIKRPSTTPSVSTVAKSQTLDQSDFLTLLTAQLKNQDPFNPTDNTQMVAQMAQFSQLSATSEMSSTLKSINDKLGSTSTSDALAYVGKNVLTAGNVAYGRTTGGLAGSIELAGDASDVTVTIQNANGQNLKTMDLGKASKGTLNYDWDGKTDAGQDAGSGPFTISVAAQNSGKTVAATSLVWAPVAAVSIPASGAATLSLPGLGNVAVSAIRQVG